MPVTTDDSESS